MAKTTNDLANLVAEALELPQRITKVIVEEFFVQMAKALEDGEPVYLHGFGQFLFSVQKFYERYYVEQGVKLPENARLKICRFQFVPKVKRRLNGFVTANGSGQRYDYKRKRLAPGPERERRIKAGITLKEICDRMSREVSTRG